MNGTLAPDGADQESAPPEKRILRDLGFFGHYLHLHRGGRNGKQHILLMLRSHGSAMGQKDLQERSCITSASLSEVVAKLECEGLVTRTRSETDRRQLTLALTPEGERRAQEIHDAWALHDQELLSCLSAEERSQLAGLLDRLATHWMELDAPQKGEDACSKN